MADLATARAAARLLTACLDQDPAARAAELATGDPAALAAAVAEIAASALRALTPPDQPGALHFALIHGLGEAIDDDPPRPGPAELRTTP
jgi:hypothetical protein